ncbi:NAD(P)/FAD-dependent oxidoreductase [Streptomyces sp. CSDS2]|uniref:FAD-dependent oxidoreductase n=1 Tax=Streptomyces sp. CSDS2 TaxID=3055051 RepID=UPI0025B0C1DC|nr:NAD(P)/FAD-dependent oxidoreductase [Streptomyces sp. CSDS2]MDN3259837.1 NAD(P)/FAD-dependent oxidoreductase [Streptomyces sp. CSDS2]
MPDQPTAPDRTIATDVCVVGAGPVGLLAALALGRQGWQITLLERRPQPPAGAEPKGPVAVNIVQPVTLHLLDRLGLLDRLTERAGVIPGAEIYFGGHLAARHSYAELDGCPVPHALSIRSFDLVRLLLAELADLPNATVIWDADTRALTPGTGGSSTLTVRTGETTVAVQARFVIAADGRDSTARELAGIPAEVVPSSGSYLDVVVPNPPGWNGIARAHFGTHGYLLETRRADEGLVLVWITDAATAAQVTDGPIEGLVTMLSRVVPRLADWIARHVTDWEQVRRVQHHFVHTKTWSQGNVVLVGDSAHGMHAFGGQGLNTSLQDAACLAEAVDSALRGEDASGIESYEAVRRPFIEAFQSLQVTNTQQPPAAAADEQERAPEFEVLALGQPAIRPLIADAAAFLAADTDQSRR